MTDEEKKKLFMERREKVVKGISLVDRVKMRLVSTEEIEDLSKARFASARVSRNTFVLVKHITAQNSHEFRPDKIMRNIVLGLRLLKGSYVSGSYIFYILLAKKKRLFSAIEYSWDETQPLGPWESKYVLNFDEIPTLKRLVKEIQRVNFTKRKSLRLACKRFQRTYEKGDAEDQLIDMMIAFEALFLKGEKAVTSASQVIAVACSALLGKSDEEREEIKSFLIRAYSIRNHIVHGAEYKKPSIEMSEFVSKIEDYLRESIKKLLD